jgi:hypothetical protein
LCGLANRPARCARRGGVSGLAPVVDEVDVGSAGHSIATPTKSARKPRASSRRTLAVAEDAVNLAETVGQPCSRANACEELGHQHLDRLDLDRAVSLLEQALRICELADLIDAATLGAAFLGDADGEAGRVAEGESAQSG